MIGSASLEWTSKKMEHATSQSAALAAAASLGQELGRSTQVDLSRHPTKITPCSFRVSGCYQFTPSPRNTVPTTRKHPSKTKQGRTEIKTSDVNRFRKNRSMFRDRPLKSQQNSSRTLCTIKNGLTSTFAHFTQRSTTTATSLFRLKVLATRDELLVRWCIVSRK